MGLALEMARRSEDFPALGNPTWKRVGTAKVGGLGSGTGDKGQQGS